MITIVDYGMGNLGSIVNMCKRIGVKANLASELGEIDKAEKLILPGVGAFDKAMQAINGKGFREVLDRKVLDENIPVLGICLGMQLLTKGSEEGREKGLGWINAQAYRFETIENLKVPHMGWNFARKSSENKLTQKFEEHCRFYFVHSYKVLVEDESHSMLKTQYGCEFESGISRDNIYGVQFHPEKSHKFGMSLLKSFAEI